MNKEEKDIYIEAIKFGIAKLKAGKLTTMEEVKDHLTSMGFEENWGSNFLKHLYLDIFGTEFMKVKSIGNSPSFLNSQSYFNYLEYLELQHARETAQQAQEHATKAIRLSKYALWISATLALVSILVSLFNIFHTPTVKIEKSQTVPSIYVPGYIPGDV